MTIRIMIIGALDTKGAEFAFLRDQIQGYGVETLVVNIGVIGEPSFAPDISAAEVADVDKRHARSLVLPAIAIVEGTQPSSDVRVGARRFISMQARALDGSTPHGHGGQTRKRVF